MKSAQVAARPNVPPYGMPMIPMDNDDGVSFKGFVSLLFLHYYVQLPLFVILSKDRVANFMICR